VRMKAVLTLSTFAMVVILLAGASAAQEATPRTNLDIPFLNRDEIGARWAGMGGACMAIVDDGAAAYYNPAGLGYIRRIEIGASFNRRSLDIESDWFGQSNTSSVSSTRFEDLAVSYPFPTYRGSFVLAASVFRPTSFDQYLDRQATRLTADYHDVEQRKVTLTAWSGAAAVQLSPNIFFGAEAHFYTGDLDFEDNLYPWGPCEAPGATFSQSADLGGYGGTIGLTYVPHPLLSFGVVARTPQRINVDGSEIYTEADGTCDKYRQSVDYDIDIPYSLGLGVAVRPPDLSIAADLVWTDWEELDYPGKVRDIDTGQFLFDPTTDVRLGVEYSVPVAPVRVRAGYAYVPLALNVFEIEKNRHRLSFGAGTIVEGTVTLDAAWQRTSFEREDRLASYSEKRTSDRLLLSFAYRF
jgi:long-subunit fatty acid transport protein